MDRHNELTDADYWDGHWRDRPTPRVVSPRHGEYGRNGILLKTFRRHAPGFNYAQVLELGGGSSYRLLALSTWSGAQAVAIDYSPEGIRTINGIFAANGCQVEAALADILKWDADGRKFDLIVHWGLLEHFADPGPVLEKCAQLLAPGGIVFFSMPNMDAWGAHIWRRFCPENWNRHIYHSDSFVDASCKAVGLQITKTFYFGYPLINIAAWEHPGRFGRLCSWFLSKLLLATVALGWIIPMYHRGARAISSERGFMVRHARSDDRIAYSGTRAKS